MYKMICLDIDGTLLNSNHKISKKTKDAIRRTAEANQTWVILVSARMPNGVKPFLKELEIDRPFIGYGGGMIVNSPADDQVLFDRPIDCAVARELLNDIKQSGFNASIYSKNDWFVECMDPHIEEEIRITGLQPLAADFDRLLQPEREFKPNKMMCIDEPDQIVELENTLLSKYGDQLTVYRSKPTYLEIVPIEVTKSTAIKALQQRYGISAAEIIAIGDNYNDIDMLAHAGLGVAMGNAPDAVKRAANLITASNDEDGIAEIIQKYLP